MTSNHEVSGKVCYMKFGRIAGLVSASVMVAAIIGVVGAGAASASGTASASTHSDVCVWSTEIGCA
jgi:hypothetical protein